ncbi:hypothetical protein GCM10010909_02140 [Acidocella aquatica]|uniref:Lipoprotein n=1 Tax=Acidocella aquatica TaxID=1922313 RepID=A0ABQ6A3T2_9PROT|nr:hypothetical protein [Acidocella aquatica]GLR65536.1 hypothetical protein GCM10010909_02140 [Acidocella aquatica]
MIKRLAVLLPLALAACGTLPEPFYGNPGPEGARLSIPPAPVLMVPPPAAASLLDAKSAPIYAKDLAAALVNYDIPSIAGAPMKGGWLLTTSASRNGDTITPAYVITGPDGKTYGNQNGAPIAAAAWSQGDPAALNNAATTDAQALSKTLTAINARIQGSNPQSLENRPPRIFIGPVTGAPGDGNHSLPLNLGRDLPGPDDVVVTNPAQADFTVTGNIVVTPGQNGQVMVELDWSVQDANHRKIGQVTQLHPLALADITPYWGDVAAAAATEAATGIQQVIANAVLKKGS